MEIKGNNKGRSPLGKELWQKNTNNEYKWKKITFALKFKIWIDNCLFTFQIFKLIKRIL